MLSPEYFADANFFGGSEAPSNIDAAASIVGRIEWYGRAARARELRTQDFLRSVVSSLEMVPLREIAIDRPFFSFGEGAYPPGFYVLIGITKREFHAASTATGIYPFVRFHIQCEPRAPRSEPLVLQARWADCGRYAVLSRSEWMSRVRDRHRQPEIFPIQPNYRSATTRRGDRRRLGRIPS